MRYLPLTAHCDVAETLEELRARGVTIVAEPFVAEPLLVEAIGRKLALFADSFGNLIELAEMLACSPPHPVPTNS